jgi:hypothetical protein
LKVPWQQAQIDSPCRTSNLKRNGGSRCCERRDASATPRGMQGCIKEVRKPVSKAP